MLENAAATVTFIQIAPFLLPAPRTPTQLRAVDVMLANAAETVTVVQAYSAADSGAEDVDVTKENADTVTVVQLTLL